MTQRHLILIGIDGLRVDRAFGSGLAPHLDDLAARGSLRHSTMPVPTISGPGWSTILTGLSHAEHGVVDNSFHEHRIAPGSDFLSRIAASDPTAFTFAAVGWPTLADPAGPGPVISTREDDIRASRHHVVCLNGELYSYAVIDEEICRRAVVGINLAGPSASFTYLGQPDEAGHYWGVQSSAYDRAVRDTDRRVGRIVRAVESRVAAHDEEWIVAVTTDHGHVDEGGHGAGSAHERQTFLLAAAFGGPVIDLPSELRPEQFADVLIGLRGAGAAPVTDAKAPRQA